PASRRGCARLVVASALFTGGSSIRQPPRLHAAASARRCASRPTPLSLSAPLLTRPSRVAGSDSVPPLHPRCPTIQQNSNAIDDGNPFLLSANNDGPPLPGIPPDNTPRPASK